MDYTQLFRSLREAKGLTLDGLATKARCHRNTVTNVETGRPVKFKTIARLMVRMGYPQDSKEMKAVALLWLESVSGIPFSRSETETAARKAVTGHRSASRDQTRLLETVIAQANLNADQIGLLVFAARHPEALAILESVRDLVSNLSANDGYADLKVAEDP